MKIRTIAVMLGAIGAFAVAASAANITLDPSFTSGFSSDYTQVTSPQQWGPGGQWIEGTYAINTDPNIEHGLWSSFTAPNGGNMLIVNGAVTAGEQVWDVPITAGTYNFSALVANNYASSAAVNAAQLVLELNGVQVSSVFSNPNPAGQWKPWDATITVGSGTLSIVDLNTQADGNDFSLASVPDGGLTVALLGGALIGLQALRRKLSV
jgi:hypothetical protein